MAVLKNEPVFPFKDEDYCKPRHIIVEGSYEEIGYEDPLLSPDVIDERHPYGYDLDILGPRSLRALMGPTPTPTGTETLRRWLSAPSSPAEISRRQGAVAALAADSDAREARTGEALLIDSVDRGGWQSFLTWCDGPSIFGSGDDGALSVPGWSVVFARVAPVVTFAAFGYWFFTAGTSALVWLLPLAVQGTLALRWKRAFGTWFDGAGSRAPGLRRHHSLFAAWESYAAEDPLLRELQDRLTDSAGVRASTEIRALERWLDLAGSSGSMIHEIVVILFLWDVHAAVGLEAWRTRAGASVADWFEALGELEALSALAVLAHDHPEWRFPTVDDAVEGFEATGIGHPLLPDDVRRISDVRLDPPLSLIHI